MKRRAFILSAAAAACSRGPRLNVYNWSDYVAPETIPDFERETGIFVRYGTYESVQEMLAKVMSGNSGWDVVFPSADYIQPMREMGLLAPLRPEWLPHLDALDAPFRHPPWDPELRWSVPYMWGVTGIAYQTSLDRPPCSWGDLWNPRLAGKITMLDDPPEVLGACLKMLGYSLNSSDPAQLRRAQQEAIAQKKLLRAYLNAEVRDQLVAGDVAAAQAWAITAAQAIEAAPDKLAFAFPSEGFARFADTVAVLRESRRQQAAHRFIDYLLRPEVSAKIATATQTATANGAARALLPAAMRDNPVLYPSGGTLARGEWFQPQSAASQRLRDRLWTEIKSA
ncbi:MAG: spermidine/putrescine ABC transporter substrate-binding protein [Bryobacterales bacterium]|nr:spermidine/putrescine ABC transporter substrate-binding protein [Bryobacterales bacterium]MBV9401309.1 spermidine/putrescine ABC transporter substrate-binding protein [Bryobacterales bacterium]